MISGLLRSRLFLITAAVALMASVLSPLASADSIPLEDPIIGVATAPNAPNCSSNGLTTGGGLICSGNTTAFSLTGLINGTQVLQAVVGTQTSPVYLVNNDTGRTAFSLLFNASIAFNQFIDCQENGSFAGNACTVSGSLGTVGNSVQYGPPSGLTNGQYWNPNALISFTGVGPGNFEITFASFGNGDSGQLTGVPEPGTLLLLGAGLGAVTLMRKKLLS